jgi:transcriptional regulator with XRE-family HTH domain
MADEFRNDPVYVAERAALEVATQVHRRLEAEGKTQGDLAAVLSVSKGYVSQILGGNKNMTLLTLAKLACALDVELVDLLSPEVEPPGVHVVTELKSGAIWEFTTTAIPEMTGSQKACEGAPSPRALASASDTGSAADLLRAG